MGTRRKFILGTLGVAGALAIGWGVLPPRQRLTTSQPLPTGEGEVAFNGWVKIARDGTVHFGFAGGTFFFELVLQGLVFEGVDEGL